MRSSEVRDSHQPIDTAVTTDRLDVINVGQDGDECVPQIALRVVAL